MVLVVERFRRLFCPRLSHQGRGMDWLEKVYNDVDADLMIMAIDQLAERYGYTSDMDETIEIDQEDKWRCWETFESNRQIENS